MIKLRKIEPNDLPFLYQWENDAASWADGANHNPLSQQDLRDYIASTTGDIYRDGQLRLRRAFHQLPITNHQSPMTNHKSPMQPSVASISSTSIPATAVRRLVCISRRKPEEME